jgi:DNA-binding CsgD family transcriptional regulator
MGQRLPIPDVWGVPDCKLMSADEMLDGTRSDSNSYAAEVQAVLTPMLGLDVCVVSSVDPATGLLTSCEVFGVPRDDDRELRIFELEWFSADPLRYHELANAESRAGSLRQCADPTGSRRYREIMEPNGAHDEIRLSCVVDGSWWATVTGYRRVGAPEFSTEEVRQAAGLSETIARGFRKSFLHTAVAQPGDLERPPGAFNIDRRGEVVSTTAAAETWLDTLPSDRVSTLTKALAVHADGGETTMTVSGSAGPLSFHASPLKGSDDHVSVIVEYPRPIHLASLVIEAYGLTPREREVTELVLLGLVTKQIARRLAISEYTVQDHLKSAFAKTDTATRGELCAALYTRFYMEPQRAGTDPSPYGYFLSPS